MDFSEGPLLRGVLESREGAAHGVSDRYRPGRRNNPSNMLPVPRRRAPRCIG
jgi:hypothetical protein